MLVWKSQGWHSWLNRLPMCGLGDPENLTQLSYPMACCGLCFRRQLKEGWIQPVILKCHLAAGKPAAAALHFLESGPSLLFCDSGATSAFCPLAPSKAGNAGGLLLHSPACLSVKRKGGWPCAATVFGGREREILGGPWVSILGYEIMYFWRCC